MSGRMPGHMHQLRIVAAGHPKVCMNQIPEGVYMVAHMPDAIKPLNPEKGIPPGGSKQPGWRQ